MQIMPPGSFYSSKKGIVRWYNPEWFQYKSLPNNKYDKKQLREALEAAVEKSLMADVPYGWLEKGLENNVPCSGIAQMP